MSKTLSVVEAIYLSKSFAPHLLKCFDLHSVAWKKNNALGQFSSFWKDDPLSLHRFINNAQHVAPFSEIASSWLEFLYAIEPHSDPNDFESVLKMCINLFVFVPQQCQRNDIEDYLRYGLSYGTIYKSILPQIWIFNPLTERTDQHIFDFMCMQHTPQAILQSLIDFYNVGKNETDFYSPSVKGKNIALRVEQILALIPAHTILSLEDTAELSSDNLCFARWLSEQQQNLFLQVLDSDLDDSKDCPRKI